MSDTIRWGVLSTAQIGRNHVIPAIQNSRNGEVVAISSRSVNRAEGAAEELGIARAYRSYEEVLEDPEVDAVYNPLPVGMHAEWSIRCAEAGKPTLCEKPLAENADAARRMVDAFSERDLLLAEGLMYRHHPLTRKVVELIAGGAIGDVKVVHAVFCALCPDDDNIRLRPELAGGAMRDVGCYCVSVARLLTGEEPVRVAARGGFGPTGVDLRVTGGLEFPSGALASFACALRTEFGCHYDVYGTEGRIFVEGGVVPGANSESKVRLWREYECDEITIPPADHYQLMVEDFADALLNDREPLVPPEEGVRNMRTIDRVMAAIRQ